MNNELKIKLIIDGKEAVATISKVDDLVNNLSTKASKPISQLVSRNDLQNIGSMNQLFAQTGFLLSDLDMMFVNTRIGLMSISNNVSMLTQTFANASAQAKSMGMTFVDAIRASITPMNALVLGINAVMFIMQALSHVSDNTTKSLKEQQKSVDELKNKYENLTRYQLESRKTELELELTRMTREMQAKYGERSKLAEAFPIIGAPIAKLLGFTEMSEEEQKRYDTLIKELQALDQAIAKHGYIKELEAQRNLWLEKRKELNEENQHAYDKIIQYYNDLIDKANKSIESKKKEKTIYQELGIRTKEEIDKEINKLQILLKQTTNLRDQLEIRKKIYELEKESLSPYPLAEKYVKPKSFEWGKTGDLLSRGFPAPKGEFYIAPQTNKMAEFIESLGNPVERYLQSQEEKVVRLGYAWQSTGQIMSNSIAKSLGLLKNTDNVLANILNNLINIGLQAAVFALIGTITGAGSFGQIFKQFFLAEGGVISEKVYGIGESGNRYIIGEGGEPEAVIPYSKLSQIDKYYIPKVQVIRIEPIQINVSGHAIAKGRDLDYIINKQTIIKQKYY